MRELTSDDWDARLKHIIRLAKNDLQHKGFPIQIFKDDDLWQEAWTALGKANTNFDPAKAEAAGAKFSTYAHKFVFHELRKFMFKQARIAAAERSHEDISSITVRDFVPDRGGNSTHLVERQDLLMHAMNGLEADEIQMLSLYYVDGLSYREIEDIMEVSYTTVRNKMSRSLDKIRKRIKVEDEDYCGR